MPRAGALATALIIALALGTSGCDLVDSLTPFGVGTQDYSGSPAGGSPEENLNGLWSGATASGGLLTFQVADNTETNLIFYHIAETCTITFDLKTAAEPITNNQFTVEMNLPTGGTVVFNAGFASADTASGTYVFQGLPTGTCPTSGTGTFTARKTTF